MKRKDYSHVRIPKIAEELTHNIFRPLATIKKISVRQLFPSIENHAASMMLKCWPKDSLHKVAKSAFGYLKQKILKIFLCFLLYFFIFFKIFFIYLFIF